MNFVFDIERIVMDTLKHTLQASSHFVGRIADYFSSILKLISGSNQATEELGKALKDCQSNILTLSQEFLKKQVEAFTMINKRNWREAKEVINELNELSNKFTKPAREQTAALLALNAAVLGASSKIIPFPLKGRKGGEVAPQKKENKLKSHPSMQVSLYSK